MPNGTISHQLPGNSAAALLRLSGEWNVSTPASAISQRYSPFRNGSSRFHLSMSQTLCARSFGRRDFRMNFIKAAIARCCDSVCVQTTSAPLNALRLRQA